MKWKSVVSTENSAEMHLLITVMHDMWNDFLKILVFVTSNNQNLSYLRGSASCDRKCKNDNIDGSGGDCDRNNTMSESSAVSLWVISINFVLFLYKFPMLVLVINIMNIKPLAIVEENSYRQTSGWCITTFWSRQQMCSCLNHSWCLSGYKKTVATLNTHHQ
jgi:hypothetical protein